MKDKSNIFINMDNFDLKKYLVENKVTTNSKVVNEGNNKQSTVDLINKWKANPDEFGVYDIIGGLSWLAEKYNNQEAEKLANEIEENEEYDINYLINLVEKRLIQGGNK
jgi:hypothetical protein